jgi:hypothetical protein
MTVIQLNTVLCSHGEIPRPSTQIIICKTRDSSYSFYYLYAMQSSFCLCLNMASSITRSLPFMAQWQRILFVFTTEWGLTLYIFALKTWFYIKSLFHLQDIRIFLSISVTALTYIQVRSPSVLGSVATVSSSVNTKFLAVLDQEFVYHWGINCRVLWPWKWWRIMRKKGS